MKDVWKINIPAGQMISIMILLTVEINTLNPYLFIIHSGINMTYMSPQFSF